VLRQLTFIPFWPSRVVHMEHIYIAKRTQSLSLDNEITSEERESDKLV